MNIAITSLELAVLLLGLGTLLVDLWAPEELKRKLGYAAAFGLGLVFLFSFSSYYATGNDVQYAFGQGYILDGVSLFFKRFFLLAGIVVLVMATEYSSRITAGISEYYSLIVFALLGMLFSASANDFAVMFVSIELITVTFYILTSFRRNRVSSLEAGVKYLILGGVSSAFLVYGIALVFGTTGAMEFGKIAEKLKSTPAIEANPVFIAGILLVLSGVGFKVAAFPFQIWAPDVYQGAPAPTTAFLAVGSKAAGVVLLLRLLGSVFPEMGVRWEKLLMGMAAVTILYGSLCAIPQRNIKRLMGYSSIASAGYLMLGFSTMTRNGSSAVMFYMAGYLFTVLTAFMVITVVVRETDVEDMSALAGLAKRSPLLAAALTVAMVSLAGVPPLAGFFGKFLLIKAVVEQGAHSLGYYCLLGVAIVGVIISLYYYFGVVKAIYWAPEPSVITPINVSKPAKLALYACIVGILYLGMFPSQVLSAADEAVKLLRL